jgi:hypothetical protein
MGFLHGSTTSVEKLTLLKKSEIQPFLIVLESDKLLDLRTFAGKHYSYRHSSK